ncbi:MAG: DUF370 domain-containing protein [Clostridia bacterium]|nr:DUF370 domain-containing protein [Clostridia bacterium]MBR2296946.1 DUF370 domain-containing protein [Clostridia bacterium]
MKLINIGFGNMILDKRIVALISPDSAPAKRAVAEAKENGRIIDCTSGRRTKSIIITDTDHVVLSALSSDAVASRINGQENDDLEG